MFNIFYEYLKSQGVPDNHIIRIALDDPDNERFLDPSELYSYLREHIKDSSGRYYIFLDEVQLAISREDLKNRDTYVRLYGVLNGLLRRSNVDVYVTGSNSKLLSKDVLTEFRGRGDEIHIAPLSFSEYYGTG